MKTTVKRKASVRDAIATHVEGMLLDGERVPPPTSIDVHQGNPDHAGGVWALVPVDKRLPFFLYNVELFSQPYISFKSAR